MRGRRYVRRSIVASACVGMLGLLPIGPARAQIMGQGSLLEQTQLPNGSWISFDVTPADHGPIFSETAPVVDPVTGYQNAYIVVPDERLVEYTRFPAGNWSSVDLTAMWSLPLVGSNPVPFVDVADHNQIRVSPPSAPTGTCSISPVDPTAAGPHRSSPSRPGLPSATPSPSSTRSPGSRTCTPPRAHWGTSSNTPGSPTTSGSTSI